MEELKKEDLADLHQTVKIEDQMVQFEESQSQGHSSEHDSPLPEKKSRKKTNHK